MSTYDDLYYLFINIMSGIPYYWWSMTFFICSLGSVSPYCVFIHDGMWHFICSLGYVTLYYFCYDGMQLLLSALIFVCVCLLLLLFVITYYCSFLFFIFIFNFVLIHLFSYFMWVYFYVNLLSSYCDSDYLIYTNNVTVLILSQTNFIFQSNPIEFSSPLDLTSITSIVKPHFFIIQFEAYHILEIIKLIWFNNSIQINKFDIKILTQLNNGSTQLNTIIK